MSGGAVDGQFAADPDSNDHEPQLVVQAVGQDPPEIVFDHGKEDRKCCHHSADPDQAVGSGEPSSQRINGQLRREGTQPDRTGDGRFRVRVLQPVVQKWKRSLDPKRHQDQCHRPRPDGALFKPVPQVVEDESRSSLITSEHRDAGQQQDSRPDLDDQVPQSCTKRTAGP